MMISIIFAVGFMAGALIIISTLVHRGEIDWDKVRSSPNWSFSGSWASTIGIAGTVVNYGAVLGCFSLPTQPRALMDRSAYLALAAVAGSLCAVSPLQYAVSARLLQASRCASSVAFMMSAATTTTGVLIQLFGGAALLWELCKAKVLPAWLATMPCAVSFFAVLVFLYARLTVLDEMAPNHIERSALQAWPLL